MEEGEEASAETDAAAAAAAVVPLSEGALAPEK
jgi:hypothetical protein